MRLTLRILPPWRPVERRSTRSAKRCIFLRMSGVFYCRSEFTAPWALDAAADAGVPDVSRGHRGPMPARGGRARSRVLRPGDLALVPHGEGHRLISAAGVPAARLFDLPRELVSDRYEILRHGGGGAATTMICGAVRFDHPAAHHLLAGCCRG